MYNCTSLRIQLYIIACTCIQLVDIIHHTSFLKKKKNPTNFVMTRFLRLFQNQQFDYFLILLQVSDVYIEYRQFERLRQTLSLGLQ